MRQMIMLLLFTAATSLTGCRNNQVDSSIPGSYEMNSSLGRLTLELYASGKMRETAYPKQAVPVVVEGKWKADDPYISLSPYIDFDPSKGGKVFQHDGWSGLTNHDYKGHLQLVVNEDLGLWFKKN